MPGSLERSRRELALQLALAVSITTIRGYANPDAYQVYAQAQSLSQQVGDVVESFQALYGLWRYAVIHAELEEAQVLGQQLMDLAQNIQDVGLLVEAHRAVGVNLFHIGEFESALPVLEQGIALYDPEQHREHAFLYGHDPAASCIAYLAHTLWMLGHPEQAQVRIHDLLRLAWDLAHPFSLAYSQTFGAAIGYQLQHNIPGVLEWADAGLALSNRRGFPFWRAQALILRGWALAEQGDGTNGVAQIRQGLDVWQATGARGVFPYFSCLLAEAYAKTGQSERGLTAVDEGLAATNRTNERFYEAELYRMRGELLLLRNARSAAESAFERGLKVAQQQQARSLEQRAIASLNRL
jgi:predicted ATPase